MSVRANKSLEAVENDLKQLMPDVSRAIEKAQAAIVKIAAKTEGIPAVTNPTPSGPSLQ
jgi:hypothetical protein